MAEAKLAPKSVDFIFDTHGALVFGLALSDRAAIHARNFFSPRGSHFLGTWLFSPEDGEVILRRLERMGTYTVRVNGAPINPGESK
jgi:hypothetical protein